MKPADVTTTMPRLVLPSWRISREATLTELCTAFVDRSRAEGLSPATERYYRQACVTGCASASNAGSPTRGRSPRIT
jgi:hypothetical protein